MHRFTGLIAAAPTPFHADGSLNLGMIDLLAQRYLEAGVAGAFVCGTTGEGHSLTVSERRQVTARWVEAAGGRLPVLVHVGHNCQADAVALAAHAGEVGAAAISAQAPSYFKPATMEDLIDFLAPIAAAAPSLPFHFYDIPAFTGVRFPTNRFLERGAGRIPTLAGVKYSDDDLMTFQSCLRLRDGAFDVFLGKDELLLAGLAFGMRGAIGSTYNYAAPVYRRVMEAFEAGDMAAARHEQHKAVALITILLRFGVLPASKGVMRLLGVDCGPVRPPLHALTEPEMRDLYEQLVPLDVFPGPLRLPGAISP